MSIYNRSYMQAGYQPNRQRSYLKILMIVLVAVFLVQNVFQHWFQSRWIEDTLALSLPHLSHGMVHTLLTYGFLHGMGSALPWHLLGNLLALYFAGRFVQEMAGPDKFLEIFLGGVLLGGATWLAVRLVADPGAILLGASAGVLAVVTIFCLILRDQPIQLLFLPVSFRAIHLLYFLAGLTAFLFLFDELPGGSSDTAHSAHLGGMAAGYLYHRFLMNRPSLLARMLERRTSRSAAPWERRKPAVKAAGGGRFTINIGSRDKLQKEVDRILDKINEEGFGSLTPEEKEVLDRAKEQMR